jgi:uncharacterized protein (DUF2141 family)
MKNFFLFLFVFFTINIFAQNKHSLTLNISGYSNVNGNVFIAVYNSKESYMNSSKAFYLRIIKPEKNKTLYTFNAVPEGIYAVAVFYDENKNGKLDHNFFGVPKELYGFSNNARGWFSSPKFDKAKFNHQSDEAISIIIK